MPDIPLDTLFIVGLLLASFIGKLMEGKARNKKSKRDQGQQQSNSGKKEDGKSLEDMLRESFGEELDPVSPPSTTYEKFSQQITDHPDDSEFSTKDIPASTGHISTQQIRNPTNPFEDIKTKREWLKQDAFKSRKSLRRAFLVKEILDQPLALR